MFVCQQDYTEKKTTRPIFTKFDGKKPLDFGSKPDRVILVSKEKVTQTWG